MLDVDGHGVAGLDRVNISLDTLQRDRFLAITRRDDLDKVLDGIAAAKDAGFAPVKVNVVVVRGVNHDEIVDFAGVGQFIDSPVKVYSSGMYVRLAFAVAAHLDTVFPEGTDVKVKRAGNRLIAPGIGDDTRGLAFVLALIRAMPLDSGIGTVPPTRKPSVVSMRGTTVPARTRERDCKP